MSCGSLAQGEQPYNLVYIVGELVLPFPLTFIPPLEPDQEHYIFPQLIPNSWITRNNPINVEPIASRNQDYLASQFA